MRIYPEGDSALTVAQDGRCAGPFDPPTAAKTIEEAAPHAVRDVVASLETLTVHYDATEATYDEMRACIARILHASGNRTRVTGKTVRIPVCYGGAYGPDLAAVARSSNLSETDAVNLHCRMPHRIDMLGFLPGFAYCRDPEPRLTAARLATPRTLVPAGSVAVAAGMTGIYPLASPGGWNIVGRTPVRVYDPHRTPAVLWQPGDLIEFEPIGPDEFERLAHTAAQTPPCPVPNDARAPVCTVVNAGMHDTVQDRGRLGWQKFGFPTSGCADERSARIANILVGNTCDAAVIESMLRGPALLFERRGACCLSGARSTATLNGTPIEAYRAFEVGPGDVLDLGRAVDGVYTYFALLGGVDGECAMGSRSTSTVCSLGGVRGRALAKGDRVYRCCDAAEPFGRTDLAERRLASHDAYFPPRNRKRPDVIHIRVVPAAATHEDEPSWPQRFLTTGEFTVTSRSNRMGVRLAAQTPMPPSRADIASEAIALGTVQVPAHGDPIVALADHQTTGGYAKAGVVARVDLPRLAQALPGTRVRFELVDVATAQSMVRRDHAYLTRLERSFCKRPDA